MRVVLVGMGIQGEKRRRIAKDDIVATVDPVKDDVDFRHLKDIPLDRYDAALLCVPEAPKLELLTYLLDNDKHVLVEKPLIASEETALLRLKEIAASRNLVCYTAYNHRFEPHFIEMRDAVSSGKLGDVYRIRMFYGNGTARDVRSSPWRDQGAGVLTDLGSHLLDTLLFVFGDIPEPDGWEVWSCQRFENNAPDHVIFAIAPPHARMLVELEVSLLSWRNHFVGEIVGSTGTLKVESLCKWGLSILTFHKRVLPSGAPVTVTKTLNMPDPTWEAEYRHFKHLISAGGQGNIANDIRVNRILQKLISHINC